MFLSRGDRDLGVAFQTHPGRQAFISSEEQEGDIGGPVTDAVGTRSRRGTSAAGGRQELRGFSAAVSERSPASHRCSSRVCAPQSTHTISNSDKEAEVKCPFG